MDSHSIDNRLGEISQWQKDHERHDDKRFHDQQLAISQLPTKSEMEDIIRDTMLNTIFKVGRGTKVTILTIATVFAAFAVITGGLKWFAGLIGIGFIMK